MAVRQTPQPLPLPSYGVRAWESHHDYGFFMQPEKHHFYELFYIHAGSGWLNLNETRLGCEAGDVLVAMPGTLHQFEDVEPLTIYGLEIASELIPADEDAHRRLGLCRPLRTPQLTRYMRSSLRRLLHEQNRPHPGSAAYSVGIALQLVANIVKSVRPDVPQSPDLDTVVNQFVHELKDRFFEAWTLDGVAEELGVSRRHFTRLFRKATGESFAEHLERLRIQHAAHLLVQTPKNVTLIAFECGYEDLSSFSPTAVVVQSGGLAPRFL
jgi:AraC family L-rhamnose operon regulatory protein RhaS